LVGVDAVAGAVGLIGSVEMEVWGRVRSGVGVEVVLRSRRLLGGGLLLLVDGRRCSSSSVGSLESRLENGVDVLLSVVDLALDLLLLRRLESGCLSCFSLALARRDREGVGRGVILFRVHHRQKKIAQNEKSR